MSLRAAISGAFLRSHSKPRGIESRARSDERGLKGRDAAGVASRGVGPDVFPAWDGEAAAVAG